MQKQRGQKMRKFFISFIIFIISIVLISCSNVPDDKIKSMISDMQSNFLQDTNPNVIEAETVDDSDSVFNEEVKENG